MMRKIIAILTAVLGISLAAGMIFGAEFLEKQTLENGTEFEFEVLSCYVYEADDARTVDLTFDMDLDALGTDYCCPEQKENGLCRWITCKKNADNAVDLNLLWKRTAVEMNDSVQAEYEQYCKENKKRAEYTWDEVDSGIATVKIYNGNVIVTDVKFGIK